MKMITALDAARRSPAFREDRDPTKHVGERDWTSFISGRLRDAEDKIKEEIAASSNVRTTGADWRSCIDWQADLMSGSTYVGYQNVAATATTATTLTIGSSPWTVDAWKGHIVCAGPNSAGAGSVVWGVVISNTASILTVDRWYAASTPGGAAGTTPNATCSFQILPGQAPAWWMTLGETSAGSAASDRTIPNEITTDGLERAIWTTYTHTSGATSYVLQKVFTATGTHTVYRAGLLNAQNSGALPFESDLAVIATMASGDTLTINHTINV